MAGRNRVAGTDLSTLDANGLADLRRSAIGIVFQSFHLLPSQSALNNVWYWTRRPDRHRRQYGQPGAGGAVSAGAHAAGAGGVAALRRVMVAGVVHLTIASPMSVCDPIIKRSPA